VLTDDPKRVQECLQILSQVSNTAIKRILLNERSDTTQLLGCFEQTSQDLSHVINAIIATKQKASASPQLVSQIISLENKLQHAKDEAEKLNLIETFVKNHRNEFSSLIAKIKVFRKGASKF